MNKDYFGVRYVHVVSHRACDPHGFGPLRATDGQVDIKTGKHKVAFDVPNRKMRCPQERKHRVLVWAIVSFFCIIRV
ncbi:hypothetical protein ATCV1_z401R [Acanthocystis turfacea chlorella virus 1]|uniref:Uncharacterized protein z401R n=1 Tax=Chlorovirus heliozoae TaxID=322019 RepID=A7K911_9PHYC|nr:hypothetical protein ATCV1_z401R [Acanthocystis turfacea chlorella virus 1]ABT16535.1 hypothetical protein ATCV1_z401R [Acanthocystis turfacea chlorella virus 1]